MKKRFEFFYFHFASPYLRAKKYFEGLNEFSCISQVDSYLSTPIPVQTCLALSDPSTNATTPTDCCFDPYEMSHNTEECILKCPYYGTFTEEEYKAATITLIVIVSVGFIAIVVAVVPLLAMEGALKYPRYYLPLCLLVTWMTWFIYVFSYFFGLCFFSMWATIYFLSHFFFV